MQRLFGGVTRRWGNGLPGRRWWWRGVWIGGSRCKRRWILGTSVSQTVSQRQCAPDAGRNLGHPLRPTARVPMPRCPPSSFPPCAHIPDSLLAEDDAACSGQPSVKSPRHHLQHTKTCALTPRLFWPLLRLRYSGIFTPQFPPLLVALLVQGCEWRHPLGGDAGPEPGRSTRSGKHCTTALAQSTASALASQPSASLPSKHRNRHGGSVNHTLTHTHTHAHTRWRPPEHLRGERYSTSTVRASSLAG